MLDPPIGRRRLLAGLTTVPALMRAGTLFAAPAPTSVTLAGTIAEFPEKPRILVAGPEDGLLNRWADALLPVLEQSLPPDTAIQRIDVGSADGVTGANQFDVRGVPDGMTVLLVPGEAALAWMVGDPRAKFDVGRWIPVMAGTSSGIVVGRPTVLVAGARARIAASGPVGPELPAMLALDLLGSHMQPVFGVVDSTAAQRAFAKGDVDAVFLRGRHVRQQSSALAAVGAQPLFTLGTLDDSGKPMIDPVFPNVPQFAGLFDMRGRPKGLLYDAWRATAAAVQLEFGLVLLQLTPAAIVALWRRAGTDAVASLPLQVTGTAMDVRLLAGSAATSNTAAAAANASTLTELRAWLAKRLNWRPG